MNILNPAIVPGFLMSMSNYKTKRRRLGASDAFTIGGNNDKATSMSNYWPYVPAPG